MPQGYVYNWTGRSSNIYGTAANWYNSTTGTTATAVPGTSDEALISTSGIVDGPGNAFELALTGLSGGLTIGGSLNGSYVFVGGTVTLASGASLASGNEIDIGDNSANSLASHIPATLNVSAGATLATSLTTPYALDILVGQNGGAGTLTVVGAGASATSGSAGFWVGNGGTGVIAVGNGAQISGGTGASPTQQEIGVALGSSGGSGTLSIYGTNTTATFGDVAEVGYGANGLLALSTGATFNAGDGANSLSVGTTNGSSNGSGTVYINGATANLNGVVGDGVFGTGYIGIGNHAAVAAYATTNDGAAATWSVLLGETVGSAGTLAITGQSQMTTARGIAVGSAGFGELDVVNSGLFINQPQSAGLVALDVGVQSGASGVVNVNGGLINDVNKSGLIVGGAGSGTLDITSGGQVLTGGPSGGTGLSIGVSSGSSGDVFVNSGANLNVAGAIIDGYGGTGLISVWAGGQVTAGGSQTATGLGLGGPGGSGIMAITGSARVAVSGQADIGQFGAGLLEITTGGTFSATAVGNAALIAGVSSGVTGTVLLSDRGSLLSLTGGLVVGSSGTGVVTIQNSSALAASNTASATALGVVVGAAAGGSGTLVVSGQALLESSAGVAVGSQGTGVLDVNSAVVYLTAAPATNFAALNVGLSSGASGTVNVAGGQLLDSGHAGMVIGGSGTGTLNITQGGVVQTSIATGNALAVGVSSGSSGLVLVTGVNSTLDVSAPVFAGNNGTGIISLQTSANFEAGNSATTDGLELGGTGGFGAMSVNSHAYASVLGQVAVGQSGTGVLLVTTGGVMSVNSSGIFSLVAGNQAGSSGSVYVTGAGSTLVLNDGAQIGLSGAGNLSLQSGGRLINTSTAAGVLAGAEGTISLAGGSLVTASTLTIETGGTLTGQGYVSASATVDSGSINATGGTLSFIGNITGAGALNITGNGDLSLGGSESGSVNFGAGGGTLSALAAADIGGTINGWSAGHFVALTNVLASSETFANGTLSLFGASSQLLGTLNFAGALASHNFTLTQAGNETLIGYHS